MNAIDKLEFKGLVGETSFRALLMNEFINALGKNGWKEGSHNGKYHFFHALVARGAHYAIQTPNDLARALRDGYTEPSDHGYSRRVCKGGACWVIYQGNEFITIRHPRDKD